MGCMAHKYERFRDCRANYPLQVQQMSGRNGHLYIESVVDENEYYPV